MNKLTKEDKKELEDIFGTSIYSTEYLPHETFEDLLKRKLTTWLEQKKKEWTEWAVAEYRLQELENRIASSNRP